MVLISLKFNNLIEKKKKKCSPKLFLNENVKNKYVLVNLTLNKDVSF